MLHRRCGAILDIDLSSQCLKATPPRALANNSVLELPMPWLHCQMSNEQLLNA